MRHPLCILALGACTLLLLASCAPQPLSVTRTPAEIQLVAADACGPLVENLATAYEDAHPWVTVQVQVFNTSIARQALLAEEADVAFLAWMNGDDEDRLWTRSFARDGLAIVVHPTTPFEDTRLTNLQEIFRGRVQEWEGVVLTVVSREEGSGSRAAFDSAVLGGRDTTLTAVVVSSEEAVIEHVSRTPGAIGYVSTLHLGDADTHGVRVLPVEGILPTPATVSDGSYPITRALYTATIGEPAGESREFIQWVLGPAGTAAIQSFDSGPR